MEDRFLELFGYKIDGVKSVIEIAEELSISPVFIEDEVLYLEEYGFMDKVGTDKYLTNIYITEPRKEICEKLHKIFQKYAIVLCEKYVPLLFDAMKDWNPKGIYSPQDDFNFLMWSVITYAIGQKLYVESEYSNPEQFMVKRKDGGEYIACASVFPDFKVSYNTDIYKVCGDMRRERGKYPIKAWQLTTYYGSQCGGWRDNLDSDYEYLYEFFSGKISKEDSQIDKFKRLYDKGYIVNIDGTDFVNIVVIKDKDTFISNLPLITEELKILGVEYDNEMYNIIKDMYPKHMLGLCRAWSSNCFCSNFTRIRVVEQLLKNGTLKLPTETQRHGLTTILFSDVLPK